MNQTPHHVMQVVGEARGSQHTQDTTNPSNEVNSNQEYIDILRKVPRILCERYELFDVLGKGAHGRIYLATDLVTHERVAIKLVSLFWILLNIYLTLIPNRWKSQAKTNLSFREKYRL